jgi:hypothetical protein
MEEQRRLREFENGAMRIFGPKREEVAEEDCKMGTFITCTFYQI